jgi:hypothetical protein
MVVAEEGAATHRGVSPETARSTKLSSIEILRIMEISFQIDVQTRDEMRNPSKTLEERDCENIVAHQQPALTFDLH